MFEKIPDSEYQKMFKSDIVRSKVTGLLIKTCLDHGFDGIVLEAWFQLAGTYNHTDLTTVVTDIGRLFIIFFSFIWYF